METHAKRQLVHVRRFANAGNHLHFLVECGEQDAAKRSQLIAMILGFAPDFQAAGLSKELVYPLIYPAEPPVKGKLDKLMTEALKLVRSYIVVTESGILNNDVTEQIILAKYYREKNLAQRFKLSYEHTRNLLEPCRSGTRIFFTNTTS